MKFFHFLSLKFSNSSMEQEFSSIRCQGILRDYKVTLQFLFFMNILAAIQPVIDGDFTDFTIAIVTVAILILLFMVRNRWKTHIQYLTLFALFSYNFSRLAWINLNYTYLTATSLFFQGYAFSAIQTIVIRRINEVRHRIYGIILSLTIRSVILMGTTEATVYDTIQVVTQIFIDVFLIYIFYSSEKTERKVFENFYQNREELMKFKELLADSLPQSITVLECETQKPLFSNNAFLTTLEHRLESDQFDEDPTIPMTNRPLNEKPKLRSLYVDPSTLSEVGALQHVQPLYCSANSICLGDMIEKVLKENLMGEKAMSLSASHLLHSQKRLFEVILKKVKWDSLDAVAVILNDTTNQEKLISLKVANNNKDRIIATVSHELRTPIHGIMGLIETIEKKVNDHEVLEELSLCKNNASLLLCHFNSILDFHQISTGNLRLNPTKISLHKVLRDVVRLFKFQCKAKNIFLDLVVGKDLSGNITTDESRLKEILVNLLGNALKFTFKGGIKLEAKHDPTDSNFISISVSDTGIGIKEEDKARLFNLLGQEDLEGRVNKNGAGFGLSISNALAGKLSNKENEIVITLSENEGGGSQFSFRILKNLTQNANKCDKTYAEKTKYKEKDTTTYSESIQQYSKDIMLEKDDENCLNEYSIKETIEESMSSQCYEEFEKPLDIPSRIASYVSLNRRSTQEFKYFSKSLKSSFPVGTLGTLADGIIGNNETGLNDKNGTGIATSLIFTPRKKEYIVVVDDSPFNLLIAQNLIKDLGYLVKVAIGGQEAIEIVKGLYTKGETIKIILMDCQMPVMDGYETTKNLKEMMNRKEIPEVPIIAWTANNSEEDVESCYKAGMVGHLPKPASQENLYKAISKFV